MKRSAEAKTKVASTAFAEKELLHPRENLYIHTYMQAYHAKEKAAPMCCREASFIPRLINRPGFRLRCRVLDERVQERVFYCAWAYKPCVIDMRLYSRSLL